MGDDGLTSGTDTQVHRVYDAASNEKSAAVYRDGVLEQSTTSLYDTLGQQTFTSLVIGGVTRRVGFEYFEAGELKTVTRYSDAAVTLVGSTVYTLEPNNSGRLDTITHRGPASAGNFTLSTQDLDYNALSRITQVNNGLPGADWRRSDPVPLRSW